MILIYDFDGNNFEYEIEPQELQGAIVNIVLARNYTRTTTENESKLLLMLVNELDIIWNDKIMADLQDELHDYFYEDAYIRYQQECADTADAETWFGTKSDIVGE